MEEINNEPYNYFSDDSGVEILEISSEVQSCSCANILKDERKAIWLSEEGLPQGFLIDLRKLKKRPKFFKCFGFDCWHDYSSNPAIIEIQVSIHNKKFIQWAILQGEFKADIQLFPIDPLGTSYQFMKIIVRKTFGAQKTYMNQIFLFEENPLDKLQTGNITLNQESTRIDKETIPTELKPGIPQNHQKEIQFFPNQARARSNPRKQLQFNSSKKGLKTYLKPEQANAIDQLNSKLALMCQKVTTLAEEKNIPMERITYPRMQMNKENLDSNVFPQGVPLGKFGYPVLTSTERELFAMKKEMQSFSNTVKDFTLQFSTLTKQVQNIQESLTQMKEQYNDQIKKDTDILKLVLEKQVSDKIQKETKNMVDVITKNVMEEVSLKIISNNMRTKNYSHERSSYTNIDQQKNIQSQVSRILESKLENFHRSIEKQIINQEHQLKEKFIDRLSHQQDSFQQNQEELRNTMNSMLGKIAQHMENDLKGTKPQRKEIFIQENQQSPREMKQVSQIANIDLLEFLKMEKNIKTKKEYEQVLVKMEQLKQQFVNNSKVTILLSKLERKWRERVIKFKFCLQFNQANKQKQLEEEASFISQDISSDYINQELGKDYDQYFAQQ